jgi:hypothetical protein
VEEELNVGRICVCMYVWGVSCVCAVELARLHVACGLRSAVSGFPPCATVNAAKCQPLVAVLSGDPSLDITYFYTYCIQYVN